MKTLLAAILLATTALAANAEPRGRQIRFMCGSIEDVQVTMEKYGEHLVLGSVAPNKKTANLLFVNFETQTTSWFIHDVQADEYCMMGVGDELIIPDDSPIKNMPTGTNTIYK